MGESTREPAEGAKEQSGGRKQLLGQALGIEKVGDKRPTTAPVEVLNDAPEDGLSKFCIDDDEFLSSLSPDQRRRYEQHHRSGAPSHRSTPLASSSISEHSLRSESLVSMRGSTHSSKHGRYSGGGGSCCGDAAIDASTPPHSRQGSLPCPSLPISTPDMASPSTPRFIGYTQLATPLSVTLVDTPCFEAQPPVETLVDHTPQDITQYAT
ncbi:hypothetical protein L7F22_001820 [Adiantum nelumboides]|nr:hypothetical protein [Adiantum nelumboides]